jgi:hypothetical protein
MTRSAGLVTVVAALGLATFACAQNSPAMLPPAQQVSPSDEPATPPPATDPSMPSPSAPGDPRHASAGVRGAWRDTHLAAALPAGMSAEQACAGFKSKMQCAITVHAAHNRDIPFADLKSKVNAGQKLGALIH